MNIRNYAEENLFSTLRSSFKELIEELQANGELERYFSMVDKKNESVRKALRRAERIKRREEEGS